MTAYKNDQISVFNYLNTLASNIEFTQFIDDDFAIDYEEADVHVSYYTFYFIILYANTCI
jgi:hypothetical protein